MSPTIWSKPWCSRTCAWSATRPNSTPPVAGARRTGCWRCVAPASAGRDQIVKRALYERHGVREYWLLHPLDRVLTIYRLEQGRYTMPEVLELQGQTALRLLPGVCIDWGLLAAG